MKDQKLQKGIEEIIQIKLSNQEKRMMLQKIMQTPQPSPFMAWMHRYHTQSALGMMAVIVLCFGGIANASKYSLPGSLLYPIKVSLVEPLYGSLITKPTAKAEYQSKLAETRLIEAETLLQKGTLDTKTETDLSNLLKDHTEKLDQALTQSRKEHKKDDDRKDDVITTDFEAKMDEHAKVIETLNIGKRIIGDDREISRTAKESSDRIKRHKED